MRIFALFLALLITGCATKAATAISSIRIALAEDRSRALRYNGSESTG